MSSSTKIKFHKVSGRPATGEVGHVYFDSNARQISVCTGSGYEDFGESVNNRVTVIGSQSTDGQYPSARSVYNAIQVVDNKITNLGNNFVTTTDNQNVGGNKTFTSGQVGLTENATIKYDSTDECIKFIF